jgi:hypothetical protein
MPPNPFNTSYLNACKNIRDQSFQEIVDHIHVCVPCLDFTELFPLQKNTIVTWGHMLLFYSRVYVFRSSVLNID